jgi:hypothetical protein
MAREVFTVQASDWTAGRTAWRVAHMGGLDGGTPHKGWTLRLTFAGLTMTTACALCGLGPTTDYRITAGTANGSYDLPLSAGDFVEANCGADKQFAGPTWVNYSTSSGTCGAVAETGSNLNACIDFHFRGGRVVVRLTARETAGSPSAAAPIYYFEQEVAICSFEDGVVLNNRITAAGCYSPLTFPNVARVRAGARGGTCTITRVDCA